MYKTIASLCMGMMIWTASVDKSFADDKKIISSVNVGHPIEISYLQNNEADINLTTTIFEEEELCQQFYTHDSARWNRSLLLTDHNYDCQFDQASLFRNESITRTESITAFNPFQKPKGIELAYKSLINHHHSE
jgi:hypothetical protein